MVKCKVVVHVEYDDKLKQEVARPRCLDCYLHNKCYKYYRHCYNQFGE